MKCQLQKKCIKTTMITENLYRHMPSLNKHVNQGSQTCVSFAQLCCISAGSLRLRPNSNEMTELFSIKVARSLCRPIMCRCIITPQNHILSQENPGIVPGIVWFIFFNRQFPLLLFQNLKIPKFKYKIITNTLPQSSHMW